MPCVNRMPWLGCRDCCTHRLVDGTPEVVWSENSGCDCPCPRCTETVFDAWHHGGVFYLLTATKCDSGVPTVNSRNRVQAWDSDGERLWVSPLLNDAEIADAAGRVCSDGTNVWVSVGGGSPFLYRLDPADGSIEYTSIEFTYSINYLCPDGAGSVWLAHEYLSDGDGDGFVSLWSDGTFSDRFGGNGSATAYSIDLSGDTLYVGHNLYTTTEFADEYCTPCGFVSRYDEGTLVWISCGRVSNLSPYTDPASTFPLVPLVALEGGVVYFAFKDGSGYGAMETVAGEPQWIREIDRAIPIAVCGGRSEPIRDFDAGGGFLWIVVNRWLIQLDTSGNVATSVPHSDTNIGKNSCQFWQLNCVTSDGTGALFGGQAVDCDNPENESQDSSAVAGADCDEGTDANWCTPRDWDEVNDCGSLTTTGRRRVGGCTLAQSPPCEGPVVVNYVCGETTVSETIDTIASGEDCEGSVSWAGSSDTVDIVVTINCDGTAEVELTIEGCTITSTTATLNCAGPFGYAAVDFTFTGTCDGCDLSGCGILHGEDCEIGVSTDCCGSVPESLPVSMSSTFCSYANGVTGTATWNASLSQWECVLTVTTAVGDKTWGFALECPAMGGSAQDFTIRELDAMSMLSADCEPNATFQADMTSTCDPFELTVIDVEFAHAGMGQCCDDGTPMSPAAKATIVIG